MWIQTLDGKAFYPQTPEANKIDPLTIATVLSRIPRFSGHTIGICDVASHSIRVCALVSESLRLPALLHDAHEAYSGFGDVCSPMKSLFPGIKEIEQDIDEAIAKRFNFDVKLFYREEIKEADMSVLVAEKKEFMGQEPQSWPREFLNYEKICIIQRIKEPVKIFLEILYNEYDSS